MSVRTFTVLHYKLHQRELRENLILAMKSKKMTDKQLAHLFNVNTKRIQRIFYNARERRKHENKA